MTELDNDRSRAASGWAVYEDLDRLREENAELLEANHSAAVCAKHTEQFVGDDCLVCEVERLVEENERLTETIRTISEVR